MKKCLIILLMVALNGFAQNASADFVKINNAYDNNPKLSMKVKYDVYRNMDTDSLYQSEKGSVVVDGKGKLTKIGAITTVENDQYTLIVDNDEKQIVMLGKKITYENKKMTNEILMVKLDTLLTLSSKLDFEKVSDKLSRYTLAFPMGEYKEMKITFNTETYFIDNMILYYQAKENFDEDDGEKERPRLEVYFSHINTNPVFNPSDFTYSKYLEKHNGTLQCKPAYKGYILKTQLFN